MANEKTTKENIDRLFEEWHKSDSELEVHEYLGISLERYAHWVETDELLPE